MLELDEAQQLMEELIRLRTQYKEEPTTQNKRLLDAQKRLCMEKFDYLVLMKTARYRSFSNYEDLNQDGREALLKAMKTYNPKKGNWFGWAHHYIATRISRNANTHTAIRYPLHVAKQKPPHKENIMPVMVDASHAPDVKVFHGQCRQVLQTALQDLPKKQQQVVRLTYGLEMDKPMSATQVCKVLHISRAVYTKRLNTALSQLRESIKI